MKKPIIALSIASVIALTGCTTFDPYTGEEKTTNTAKGAGIGAGDRVDAAGAPLHLYPTAVGRRL